MSRVFSTVFVGLLLALALATLPALLALPNGSVALVLSNASAQDAPPPVEVLVDGVFGADALLEGGYTGLLVSLRNRSSTPFSGAVEVSVSEWNAPPERHRVEVDLPAGEARRAQLTVFIPTSGASIDVRYVDDADRILGLASQSVAYAAGATSVVVIAEQPARLRAALLDLQIDEPVGGAPSYPSGTGSRTIAIPIGGSVLDGRTGDPILPSDPHAYATVRMVIASAPTLARASEAELVALEDYVVGGGTLVLAPRTAADYALPVVRRFFGEVTPWPAAFAASAFAPPETLLVHCASASLEDGIGCATPLGAGIVRLVPWDLTSPPPGLGSVAETWSRSLVLRLIEERRGRSLSALPFGTGLDGTDNTWWDGTSTFGYLRRALDPNEGYRTSLALVSVLLFFYVLVVGPIHFKLIERRNQPTLALVTTPLLALACAALLFFVGYLGKGVVMRYRRLAVVELAAGSERGTERSYTGYFFTRPTSGTLEGLPGSIPRRVAAPGGIAGPRYLHGPDGVHADGIRGGLWDTLFLREDRMLDVSGGIRFELEGARISAVVNESDLALSSAFLLDTMGSAFVVGDIPAHGRAPVPPGTSWYLNENAGGWYGEGGDTTTTSISALLRLSGDEAPLARGMQSLLATELISNRPILYAWIDAAPPPTTDPAFSREWDRRLLRVHVPPALDALVAPNVWHAPVDADVSTVVAPPLPPRGPQ